MWYKSLSRRSLLRSSLQSGFGLGLVSLCPPSFAGAQKTPKRFYLKAGQDFVNFNSSADSTRSTLAWCYNSRVPGPEIRVQQSDVTQIVVDNNLPQPTTVHWHGLRVPNAMDGVPHLSQPPIQPGSSFTYEFSTPDAGTYWYHPHFRSAEQVGRGLYGPFIIDEAEPPQVDRDLTWVLDDWRLDSTGQIDPHFDNAMDASHNGRIGNYITISGKHAQSSEFAVRAKERLRLRLINAANARIFALKFIGVEVQVIALDGQPVTPHAPADGRVVLAPAMRVDLIIDAVHKPGMRFAVIDTFNPRNEYKLVDLTYIIAPPLRMQPLTKDVQLPPNTLPEPDLANAERHKIIFSGGHHSNMHRAKLNGTWVDFAALEELGKFWAVNEVVADGHVLKPMLTLTRNKSYILAMQNDSMWYHPIHLHGHSFRVIARDGKPTRYQEWRDTVLMQPNERVDIAFVADNPGDWMFHCHILEHQSSGMMSVIRVE